MENYELEVQNEDDHIYEMETFDNETLPESRTENKEKPRAEGDKDQPKLFCFAISMVFVAFLGVSTCLVYRDIQKTDILKDYSAYMLNLSKHNQELHDDLLEMKNIQSNIPENIKVIYSFTRDCRTLLPPVSGIYSVALKGYVFEVYCDTETDGGGWTVIQNRFNGSVDFYRIWSEYENGFGSIAGEHWLGNKYIHALTSQRQYELRIDLEDWEGEKRYVTYSTFSVGDQASKYKLTVSGYNGKGGLNDKLTYHSNNGFSTKDQDNDVSSSKFCAQIAEGGWWYGSCHSSNLNGLYKKGTTGSSSFAYNVMSWNSWHSQRYSLKSSKIMIR